MCNKKDSVLYCRNVFFMRTMTARLPYPLKMATALIFFLILLLGCRWIWSVVNDTPDHPQASAGILDMRGWDFEQSHSIPLQGDWEFYPGQLLARAGFGGQKSGHIQVPGNWASSLKVSPNPSFGYGTYRLRILVDPAPAGAYGFWIERILSSSEVEINGQIAAVFGEVAAEAALYQPVTRSYTATYKGEPADEIELIVRVANYSHPDLGGIVKNIRFGSQHAIDKERSLSIALQLVTLMILLLHILYAGILYLFNRNEAALPVFILLLAALSVSIASDHDSLWLQWLPLNDSWALKIKLLAYLFSPFLMLLLIRHLTDIQDRQKSIHWFAAVLGMFTVFVLLGPPLRLYYYFEGIYLFLYLVPFIWFFHTTGKLIIRKYKHSLYLLFTASAVISSLVWGLIQILSKDSGIYYPLDLIVALIGFSSFWFKKYFQNAKDNAELYRKLSESDKRKDEFLANTAHELRTPLHGIINLAQSVFNSEPAGEQALQSRSNMEQLILISRRMSHIVNNLLDLSRLRDHRFDLHPGPMSIHSAAAGVADMAQYLMKDKPVSLSVEIPADLPLAWADEKRVVQILFNLLRGALAFTDNGSISITAESLDDALLVSVSYTGCGIAAAELDRNYTAYEYVNEDTGGIGLGLNISRQLVELHGGFFELSSIPGVASSFSFTLPAATGDSLEAAPDTIFAAGNDTALISIAATDQQDSGDVEFGPRSSLLAQQKLNILAVDDDPVNLKVLADILSSGQFQVTMAGSGSETLDLLTNSEVEWDLLIADVMMPHMSGYELTRRVRKRYSHSELPILLLTARNQIEDIYAGFTAGANDYVAKPVHAAELQYRVWSLASLKRSVHERLKLEAAYLQAQIRPQFIFNTLNAITALSVIDIDQMHDLSEAFTTYLRISFDTVNSGQWVKLGDELELIRAYLHVENAILKEPVSIRWEVEADLTLSIPPLILQPFVENAVNHGFTGHNRSKELHVRIVDQPGSIHVQVRDNGTGMEDSLIRELLNPTRHSNRGAGISNTNRRLLQRYGRGLTITSIPGEGTEVSFEIPQ